MIICFLHAGELSIPGCCRFSLILKKLLMLFHPDHRFLFQFTFLIELIQIDKHRFFSSFVIKMFHLICLGINQVCVMFI